MAFFSEILQQEVSKSVAVMWEELYFNFSHFYLTKLQGTTPLPTDPLPPQGNCCRENLGSWMG